MPASQEQKVDFLLKKIGYSASKTGIAEDESTISSSSNTAKAPFEEGIASPLVIPQSSILADSGYIPTTPPGSDTPYVKRYPTSSALRMTRDSTVGTNTRSYIAYTTYNDTSSVRLTNWIDTQFGASYIIKVYKGDPNSGGVELQQAGANAGTDGWFFDYSSGILNFNGVNLPSGISATNIYIVGYRYIGATGIRPPAGIGTFESLHVAGVSTFMGNIDANSDLDVDGQTNLDDVSIAGVTTAIGNITIQNTYPSLFLIDSDNNDDFSLQNQNGVFAVRDETNNENRLTINSSGIATFANNLNVNEDLNVTGNAGIGSLSVSGISTFTSAIDANSNLTVSGISTFTGNIDANGIIEGIAGQNKIPSLYANYSDLPSAATYHGMFAHVHATGRGYYAHAGGWFELVNKEVDQRIGTGTETYNVGYLDATNLDVTGITTLGNIGISTGRITGPAITYIDPATVGDDTGLLVVKGNLQVEGTQTVVNSSTMTVTDKNIELAKGAANNAAADGGGITIDAGSDADKTWQWVDATDSWTSSEDIRIPDGKVFGFTPDVNTYIGRPAAETIAFTHGGSEKVRITSTGNVGIGSVTPQQKLTVSGGSIHVDSSGQTGNHDDIPFTGTRYNANVDGAVLFLQHSRSNTIGTKVALNVGDEVGAISFRSYNSDLSGYRSNATITAVVTGAATTGGVPSALIFSTGETNSNAQEKLRITSTGNVGINTNSPREKLDVVGDTILQGTLSVTGITTVTGNADLNGNLDVDGHTNLDNVSVAGVTTFSDDVTFTTASGNNIVFDKSDNSLKFGDGVVGKFGTGNDMTVYHSGSHSYIENTTNFLFIHSNSLALRSLSQETFIDCSLNGSVDLYYDNTKRFETTNTGVNITGITTTTQLEIGTLGQTLVGITTILDEDNFASDSATALATQQSIKAYVDGGSSPSSSLAVSADSGSNESINLVTEVLDIEGTANEIETATGTNKVVIGLPDNVSIGGTLNVGVGLSVVGVSTFNDDVKFTGNNYNVLWDKSDDSLKFDALAKIKLNDSFQFYHNTNGVIHNTAGITFIYGSGSGNISIQAQSGAQNISCSPNGGTSLYYQGSQKLYTVSDGIYVNDNLGIQDSIQHILDTNTKIRFPAADTFTVETGGNERFRIASDGQNTIKSGAHDKGLDILPVGNQQETRLRIQAKNSSGTEHTFYFHAKQSANRLDIGGTGPICFVDSSQNVGVHNAIPTSPLHVGDDVNPHTTKALLFVGPASGDGTFHLRGGSPTVFFDSTSSGDPKILIDGRSLIIRDGTFDTTGSELLRITSNGRLLASRGGLTASRNVGTKTGEIQVANTGNSSAISIIGYSNDVGGPHLMFGKSRSTNATGSTIVQDGDRLGEIAFCGADGSDIDSFGAAIKCHVDGTPGANDMPGRLEFYTTSDGGSSSVERLRIGSNGSMYLGYNSSDGLPVQDGSIPGNLRLFSIHGTGTSLGIKLTNSTTGTTTGDGVDIRLHGQTAMINQNEAYDLQLQSKGELAFRTGSTPAERLRITSTEINAKIPITGAVPAPNRNIIENGEFLVSQRMGDAASTKASSGANIQNGIENGIVDRWRMGSPSASNFSRQRVTDAPSGFAYSFKVTNDGTQYNPGNGNYSLFQQIIEAPNVARLAFGTSSAKTVTLSFYVKSSYASSTWAVALGSLTGGVYTSATRTYIKSYSISSANTWERKTITFPGDTSGTWPKTGTGGGLAVVWDLGSGGNHQGTSQNTWASSADFRFSGAKNVGDAANGSWQITGIQLEIGDTATEYEHIPIQKEIERCQRYFYCSGLLGSGSWNSTNTFHCAVHHPVAMRGRVTVGGTRSGGYSNINIEPRDQYDITVFDPDAHTHHVPDQVHSNQVMNFTISGSTTTGYSGTVAMDRNSDQFWLSAEL